MSGGGATAYDAAMPNAEDANADEANADDAGSDDLPKLGFTCGDPAGIGPEVAVAAFHDSRVRAVCRPVLFGSVDSVAKAHARLGIDEYATAAGVRRLPSGSLVATDGRLDPQTRGRVFDRAPRVPLGQPSALAGQVAYESICEAVQFCPGVRPQYPPQLDGLVTAPLNKYSLRQAGVAFPGHTEILGQYAVDDRFAMMLHVAHGRTQDGIDVVGPHGLSIVHVTLHTSVESVPALLTEAAVLDAISLLQDDLPKLGCESPRIAVAALNPHGGESGLFGDEEARVIAPAIARANRTAAANGQVAGPLPCDTLIRRAVAGEFDAVVAMYHDQGHIPVKLIAFHEAINVTLGLPFPRTSPTHGTAFDIVGREPARSEGMIAAALTCATMARRQRAERLHASR